jgi:hypothetical protein
MVNEKAVLNRAKKMKKDFSRRQFIVAASASAVAAAGLGISPVIGSPTPVLDKPLASPPDLREPTGTEERSWVKIRNKIYGAKPDENGLTGGGKSYSHHITKGDFSVQNLDDLLIALSKAKAGQIIFIPSETSIDLTTRMYIEELVLEIPEGVTLAGDRGSNGSKGALLSSDSLKTPVMVRTKGPNVRITGLRLQGPNPKRHLEHHKRSFAPEGKGREYYYKFPVSRGISTEHAGLEIDNCDISAFSGSGISLLKEEGHHIHHNFIHQCQYNGLGYGVSHRAASSLIEHNLFNKNRHSIAGTGVPGCGYTARHNIELGVSLSHCFDMHGGRDRKDNTDIAGTSIEIYNNTFRAPERAVVIRGVPEEKCEVHRNWFMKHQEVEQAVGGLSTKTTSFNNVYGKNPTVVK